MIFLNIAVGLDIIVALEIWSLLSVNVRIVKSMPIIFVPSSGPSNIFLPSSGPSNTKKKAMKHFA